MPAQRIFGIALGYEDLNDHQSLRQDPLFQIISERGPLGGMTLASPPTLCRLENRIDRKTVLTRLAELFTSIAKTQFKQRQQKQRVSGDFLYAADTWDKQRRVIVKAEHLRQGENTRFIVTNLAGQSQQLYDDVYCQRGDMENRIKEQQLGFFADRTGCHDFVANQFRVLLSAAAYILMDTLRREALADTELANAQVGTIRLKLLKIGARIVCSVRRIMLHFAVGYPYKDIFEHLLSRLKVLMPAVASV